MADVSTPTQQYRVMAEKWPKIRALMGGTEAMRNAGESYLPKHYAETKERYKERLSCSVLKNYFMNTVEHMAGKVFAKPVDVDQPSPEIEEFIKDIDRSGTSLTAFSADVFQNAVAVGLHYILVDYPKIETPLTLEDERYIKARPYWVSVPAENVLGVKLSPDKTTIEEVRLKEDRYEYVDRWEQEFIERVRVLMPGAFELWRKVDLDNNQTEWILEDSGAMSIDEVPLVPVYGKKEGPHFASPPLEDLADLNITHWQSYSDQRSILSVTRFPILGASGYDPDEDPEVQLGPFKLLTTSDPQGKYYYIEHSGTAIEAGRKDLEDLKEEMAMFGLQVFLPQIAGSDVTATQSQISNTNTQSRLQRMARSCESALNECMRLTQLWRGVEDVPKVEIRGNFEMPRETTAEIENLITMRQAGELSRGTFYRECKRRGFLSDDFNADEEKELLDNEGPTIFGGE